MSDYLDSNGLRLLWTKIKNKFVQKESGKGLSTNDFTTSYKNKLDGIASGANKYTLPTATASILGGIKVGSGLSIDGGGVLSASGGSFSIYCETYTALYQSTSYHTKTIQLDKPMIFCMVLEASNGSRSSYDIKFLVFSENDVMRINSSSNDTMEVSSDLLTITIKMRVAYNDRRYISVVYITQ